MSDNVQTITLEILKSLQQGMSEIRSDVAGMRIQMDSRFDSIEARFNSIEDLTRSSAVTLRACS